MTEHTSSELFGSLDDWQQRDCRDLAELHGGKDSRSLAEMIADDPVTEYEVERAIRCDGGWEVSFDDGLTGFFTTDKPIKAGDTLGLYTNGRSAFGSMRHGFSVNGEVIEWETPWERYAGRITMLAEQDRRKRERLEQERKQVAEWIEQLRGPYLERIQRFINRDSTFVLEGGTYETYPVLMAQRVEAWVREHHPDAAPATWEQALALVKELEAKPHKDQAQVLHAGRKDEYGVSGHQVDSAFGMAAAVLCGKEI